LVKYSLVAAMSAKPVVGTPRSRLARSLPPPPVRLAVERRLKVKLPLAWPNGVVVTPIQR
jgi:hypothetical protein